MKHEQMIASLSKSLPYSGEMIRNILDAYDAAVAQALMDGEDVELGTLGRMVTRMRDGNPAEGSPRTPKGAHYAVVFKASTELKKRLQEQAQNIQKCGE